MTISNRSLVLAALMLLPVLVYFVLGVYALWTSGLTLWIWLLLPVCWLLAGVVGYFWRPLAAESLGRVQAGRHWTDRDHAAMALVRSKQVDVGQYTPAQLVDPHFYIEQVKILAMELAAHYYPRATDPYSSLKVTEILAAVHLAVEDLEELAIEGLPASQWLTIRQWQTLGQTPKWIKKFQDSVWLTSIVYNPINLLRYVTSKATVEPLSQQIQQELLIRLYMRFIQQVGYYLIEMNSGRLRGGAKKYRQYFGGADSGGVSGAATEGAGQNGGITPDSGRRADALSSAEGHRPHTSLDPATAQVRLVLVGQAGSGKSSLMQALRDDAASEPSSSTPQGPRVEDLGGLQSFQWRLPGDSAAIEVANTPGYGQAGATAQEQRESDRTLQAADVLLLVVAANSPARQPDLVRLRQLEDYYVDRPHLRFPPILAVLTHVDLLRPILQWQPPYQWQQPQQEKEVSIKEAVDYAVEVLGPRVAAVVPICTSADPGRRWGIRENLLPALTQVLPQAQATALLRGFELDQSARPWRKWAGQVRKTGGTLLRYWLAPGGDGESGKR